MLDCWPMLDCWLMLDCWPMLDLVVAALRQSAAAANTY